MRFVDTNVLIYAALQESESTLKRQQARELLRSPDLALSVQVLQEFYYRATHPARKGRIPHEHAMAFLRPFWHRPIQSMTPSVFEQAAAISQRYQINYWDGAILAAARSLGCDAVYTEDLSAGQDYDGLRVINPFSGRVGSAVTTDTSEKGLERAMTALLADHSELFKQFSDNDSFRRWLSEMVFAATYRSAAGAGAS